jgi:hypothetical protein
MLILRFIGVFVVLIVISISMSVSGRIIPSVLKRMEAKRAQK